MQIPLSSNPNHPQQKPHLVDDPKTLWAHHHPNCVKAAELALSAIGAIAIATAYNLGIPLLGSVGALGIVTATAAYKCLDIIIPPKHSMNDHAFTPSSCVGGELYYQGDVPILTLTAQKPFDAGWAHGFLLAEHILKLKQASSFALHSLMGQPQAKDIPNTIEAIKKVIPKKYLEEMEGLVAGYQAKQSQWYFKGPELTVDDLIFIHLMPDSIHFSQMRSEANLQKALIAPTSVACTAIVGGDETTGPIFARNMDWPSFGVAGAHSLIINRKCSDDTLSTVEVAVPGLVGTITGMNSNHLSLAMNVCPGKTSSIEGIPAAIYNRMCLESCKSVEEVDVFTKKERPLGPYHLNVADSAQAKTFHFYQEFPSITTYQRNWNEQAPLITTNCNYNSSGPKIHMHHSLEREEFLNAYFENQESNLTLPNQYQSLAKALSLPYINNSITTHTVLMHPKANAFFVAFDNGWSGKNQLHQLKLEKLL